MKQPPNARVVRVLYCAPNRDPEVRDMPDTLAGYQALVEGYIECVNLPGRDYWRDPEAAHAAPYVLTCNEEGKLREMALCAIVPRVAWGTVQLEAIAGPCFIARRQAARHPEDGEDFGSLTDDDVTYLRRLLATGLVGDEPA